MKRKNRQNAAAFLAVMMLAGAVATSWAATFTSGRRAPQSPVSFGDVSATTNVTAASNPRPAGSMVIGTASDGGFAVYVWGLAADTIPKGNLVVQDSVANITTTAGTFTFTNCVAAKIGRKEVAAVAIAQVDSGKYGWFQTKGLLDSINFAGAVGCSVGTTLRSSTESGHCVSTMDSLPGVFGHCVKSNVADTTRVKAMLNCRVL